MIQMDPSEPGYREVLLLAAAWNLNPQQTIARLVDHYYLTEVRSAQTEPTPDLDAIALHRIYLRQRVDASYHPQTQGVTITSGQLAGQYYRSPSGARRAVVTTLNPGVTPNGSGWDFWIVTATGKTLRSIRYGI